MKKVFLIAVLLPLLAAEEPKVAPKPAAALTQEQVAKLYKLLAEYSGSQLTTNEKKLAFTDYKTELEGICGSPLVEVPGHLVGCASQVTPTPPPAAPAKK